MIRGFRWGEKDYPDSREQLLLFLLYVYLLLLCWWAKGDQTEPDSQYVISTHTLDMLTKIASTVISVWLSNPQ